MFSITLTSPLNDTDKALIAFLSGTQVQPGGDPTGDPPPPVGVPPAPADANVYPLDVAAAPEAADGSITVGTGADRIQIVASNNPGSGQKTTFAVLVDGKAVAKNWSLQSEAGLATQGDDVLIINGSFGSSDHVVSLVGQGADVGDYWINALTFNFVPLYFNGVADSRGGASVNATGIYNSAHVLRTDWGKPVAVAPPPPPAPVVTPVDIKGKTTLDAGTYPATETVDSAVTITGAGMGQTIIDAAGVALTFGKAVFVPTVPGITLKDMTIKGAACSDKNGAGVRDNGPGIGFTLENVELTGNQDGILTFNSNVTLLDCNFHDNGAADGFSHNIYIGGGPDKTAVLSMQGCTSVRPKGGHAVKCRAARSQCVNNTIASGGDASAWDFPDAGSHVIDGGTTEIPAGAANHLFLGYAMESAGNGAGGTMAITNHVFIGGSADNGGGIIQSNDPNAVLSLSRVTYTGGVAPQLVGWGKVNGSIAKAGSD